MSCGLCCKKITKVKHCRNRVYQNGSCRIHQTERLINWIDGIKIAYLTLFTSVIIWCVLTSSCRCEQHGYPVNWDFTLWA